MSNGNQNMLASSSSQRKKRIDFLCYPLCAEFVVDVFYRMHQIYIESGATTALKIESREIERYG
jgi:hypothetical protein